VCDVDSNPHASRSPLGMKARARLPSESHGLDFHAAARWCVAGVLSLRCVDGLRRRCSTPIPLSAVLIGSRSAECCADRTPFGQLGALLPKVVLGGGALAALSATAYMVHIIVHIHIHIHVHIT